VPEVFESSDGWRYTRDFVGHGLSRHHRYMQPGPMMVTRHYFGLGGRKEMNIPKLAAYLQWAEGNVRRGIEQCCEDLAHEHRKACDRYMRRKVRTRPVEIDDPSDRGVWHEWTLGLDGIVRRVTRE
jgi:hypothetical protein